MDTGRLKRFAIEARTILMQGVKHRLQGLGFDLKTGEAAEMPKEMEGGAVFMNDTVSTDFYRRWMSLYNNVQARSIREVAEEAAYTWFNRFMAIRIMEKQGFIAPVLEYESEDIHIPAIVNEATQGRLPQMSEANREKLMELLDDPSRTAEQFALLIVAYCHDNPIINNCFGAIADYTELLLPVNILADGGFMDMVNHTEFITEEQYASAELIGWLYQFYISDRKDEAFAKKGKYDADEIAPATQIFTPNWIVKYMVQNTIGRIYLDNNPYEEEFPKKWKYLVDTKEDKTSESIFRYDDLKELKGADLACGSGHILNEAFDLYYDLYVNEGYSRREAIENIFRYNLLGIDIDTRAKQLATFALLMKACQKDRSFLDGRLMPRVYCMPRPIAEVMPGFETTLPRFLMGDNRQMVSELVAALHLMNHADTLGSIIKFDLSEQTRNTVMIRTAEYEELLDDGESVDEETQSLLPYMHIIQALTDKYAAICMNPPYMGSGRFDATLSKYVKDNYVRSKADLFAVFMDVAIDRLADHGKYGMINMHSWMFLSSFEDLRRNLLDNYTIDTLLHLGPRTFDELSGEVVQNAAFVVTKASSPSVSLRETTSFLTGNQQFPTEKLSVSTAETNEKQLPKESGTYFRLVEGKNCSDKERMFLVALDEHTADVYYSGVEQRNFEMIPGYVIGYWVPKTNLIAFKSESISDIAQTRNGMATGLNAVFVRSWFEINFAKIGFNYSREEAKNTKFKWFPYANGGSYRKWYGNLEDVVIWEDDGYRLQTELTDDGTRIRAVNLNLDYIFRIGVFWSSITSGSNSMKLLPKGVLFSSASNACFPSDKAKLFYVLALLNSASSRYYAKIINPTLNANPGDIGKIPALGNSNLSNINYIVQQCVDFSKLDWDSHETSWDFEANPLVAQCSQFQREGCEATSYRIENFVKDFEALWMQRFRQLHENEEELNRQFIEIYGLQDELNPDVPLSEITILQQGEITVSSDGVENLPGISGTSSTGQNGLPEISGSFSTGQNNVPEISGRLSTGRNNMSENSGILSTGRNNVSEISGRLSTGQNKASEISGTSSTGQDGLPEISGLFSTGWDDTAQIQNAILWNEDVLMKQLISYAVGCMMGRYSIDKPGLILANQGDGLKEYREQVPDSRFEVDDDGIIPLMSANTEFTDNATLRFKTWLTATFGDTSLVENLNYIEASLGKSLDDYFVKDFWKDHKKMYQNRPIYWLFSSKKGAFQCLAYMHRMDAYTAERIRTKYLLPHIEWLIQKQADMEANAANLNTRERKELDSIGKQIQECREYHDRLHVVADEQIAFDLDDGVVVNYAKFGDVLAKIK